MGIRSVRLELEAKLKSTGGMFSSAQGKLERKSYKDNGERLKISIKNLKVPDRSTAQVTANGKEISTILIENGKGRIDQRSEDSHELVILEAGQMIEVFVNGECVLTGKLYVD